MHRVKLIGVVVLMQLFSGSGFGQALSEEFSIDFIDVRKGLLSNYVTKTISDEDNIKYFATEGGVSKYDGYDFSDYRPGKEHPGLKNENIETLLKDASNNIWIGTKGGDLSVLLAKTNTVKSFNHVLKK